MVPRTLFYIISVILLLGWLIGYLFFRTTSNLIHIMLVLAAVAALTGLIRKNGIE